MCVRKLVIVGDSGCGKTCLAIAFSKGIFPEVYVPTLLEPFNKNIEVNIQGKEIPVELSVWDTSDSEDYDRIRPLSYSVSHTILICFSIDSPDSLDNITSKWFPEVDHFCNSHKNILYKLMIPLCYDRKIPIVVVGCKKDLRDNDSVIEELKRVNKKPVTYKEGKAVAKKIGACAYLECSAKDIDSVNKVFKCAIEDTRDALHWYTLK